MPVLLHLDSSPMGEQSISRQLTREYANLWQVAHPEGKIIYRDVTRVLIPTVDAEWVTANYTPRELRTARQENVLALSTELTQELLDADEYVFGVPLHNWGPNAGFKLWADQIVRFGRTMQVTSSGMRGILTGKRLTAFLTAGRRYGSGAEDPSKNYLEPWMRTFFEGLGISDMQMIFVDGTGAIRRGIIEVSSFLVPHIASVRSLFPDVALHS